MEKYTKEKYLVFVEIMKIRQPSTIPFNFNVWKGVNELLDLQREYKRKGNLKSLIS